VDFIVSRTKLTPSFNLRWTQATAAKIRMVRFDGPHPGEVSQGNTLVRGTLTDEDSAKAETSIHTKEGIMERRRTGYGRGIISQW